MEGLHTASPVLALVVLLATVVTVPLVGIATAAFLRRQSRSYLLVALALGTLLARAGVAVAAIFGLLPGDLHHVLEHGLDATMAALVVAAVYDARRGRERRANDDNSRRVRR